METILETIRGIRNHTCVICGAGFARPRAGKLYCSSSCKQFAFYHRAEVRARQSSQIGINDDIISLNLRDYESFKHLTKKIEVIRDLEKRSNYSFVYFGPDQWKELEQKKKSLPQYLQKLKPPCLSIEEWSFLRVMYQDVKPEEFVCFICKFDREFFASLRFTTEKGLAQKGNPITRLFQNHLGKIAEGKIRFV